MGCGPSFCAAKAVAVGKTGAAPLEWDCRWRLVRRAGPTARVTPHRTARGSPVRTFAGSASRGSCQRPPAAEPVWLRSPRSTTVGGRWPGTTPQLLRRGWVEAAASRLGVVSGHSWTYTLTHKAAAVDGASVFWGRECVRCSAAWGLSVALIRSISDGFDVSGCACSRDWHNVIKEADPVMTGGTILCGVHGSSVARDACPVVIAPRQTRPCAELRLTRAAAASAS